MYPSAEGWLIGERPVASNGEEITYSWSNLPAATTLTQREASVRARWPIAQCSEDAKQACGLGEYQGRRWDGVHRHGALVMLAYSLLVQQRMTEPEHVAGSFFPFSTMPHAAVGSPYNPAVAPAGFGTLVA